MKIEPVIYLVKVNKAEDTATFAAVTYHPDIAKRYVAVEIYRGTTSFDDSRLSIPLGRQATFQESLRVTGQAADILEGPRADEASSMRALLESTYTGASVVITRI